MTPNTYATALRDSDQLAKSATGFPGATLENTMTPQQMAKLRGIGGDLASRANVDMARTSGSPTMQNMLADNLMRQTLGPLGLPQGAVGAVARSALGRLLGSPAQASNKLLGGEIEDNMRKALVKALLDPNEAARLGKLSPQRAKLVEAILASQPYAAAGAVGYGQ